MLMSTGDANIKADWQKVEKIMISWGYNFTIGAMCKSYCLDVPICGFLISSRLCCVRVDWVFHASLPRTIE